MPQRLPIGEQLKRLGGMAQASASQLVAGAARQWIVEHRAELLATIQQAQTERGAAMLHQFCREVPFAAGLVTLAMNGSPEMAIMAIGAYDESLAAELRKYRGNFEKLQEYWRLGADQRNSKGP